MGLAAGAAWCAAGPASGFIQYEQTTTMAAPQRQPLKMVDKLWFKGRSFRRESTYGGSKVVYVSNPAGTFVMLPGRSGAMQMPTAHGSPQSIPGLMYLDTPAVMRSMKKVGAEKVGRYQADIYESRTRAASAAKGGKPLEIVMRYWVSRGLPVPVKIMSKSTPGAMTVTVLQAAQLNIAVPDRLLQLPPGTKIHPMPLSPIGGNSGPHSIH
jgi:hypothetical protein